HPSRRPEGGGVMSAEVVVDTSWMDDGACAGADPALCFPRTGDNDAVTAADAVCATRPVPSERLEYALAEHGKHDIGGRTADRAVCATCPVTSECLEYALAEHVKHGIWGGTSERERRRIRSLRWRARHAKGGVR